MATRRCNEFEADLSALLDGELPPEREAELRAHLGECAACARLHADLRSMADRISALPRVAAPPDLLAALERELERHTPPGAPQRAAASRLLRWSQISAVAAAVLMFAFVGRWMFNASESQRINADSPAHERLSREVSPDERDAEGFAYKKEIAQTEGRRLESKSATPDMVANGAPESGTLAVGGGAPPPPATESAAPSAGAYGATPDAPLALRDNFDRGAGGRLPPAGSGGRQSTRAATAASADDAQSGETDLKLGASLALQASSAVVDVTVQTRSAEEFAAAQQIVAGFQISAIEGIAAQTPELRPAQPDGTAPKQMSSATPRDADDDRLARRAPVEFDAPVPAARRVIDALEQAAPEQVAVAVSARWAKARELSALLAPDERLNAGATNLHAAAGVKDQVELAEKQEAAGARALAPHRDGASLRLFFSTTASAPAAAPESEGAPDRKDDGATAPTETKGDAGGHEQRKTDDEAKPAPNDAPSDGHPAAKETRTAGRGAPASAAAPRVAAADKKQKSESAGADNGKRPKAAPGAKSATTPSAAPAVGANKPVAAAAPAPAPAAPSVPPPSAPPASPGEPPALARESPESPASAPASAPTGTSGHRGGLLTETGRNAQDERGFANVAPPLHRAATQPAEEPAPNWKVVAERLRVVEEIGLRMQGAAQGALTNIFGRPPAANRPHVRNHAAPAAVRLRITILPPEPARSPDAR